ncbi:baseplate assembly protein [Klebsiella phage vB_KvM-Eowyn]|uniref:Uncharacterized protein n=1 Tax=Klebsiella phage vB_KvM-Eowyn TaxID=2762819 RepID=A0A7R8MJH7_9CAUD|nr:baseplate assembly protein [Klebsiella phage vB_KvM-Eowyn]CAD5236152.1 hypothetical protein LLCLJKAH_00163 [Klebsiella phage vB_KvM-Eowyn]
MTYEGGLREIGIGRVTQHKEIGSKDILVTPIEWVPHMDGEFRSNPSIIQAKGTDAEGKNYEVSTMTDITLTATWYPETGNRITPPNVRRGERVKLYQFANQDKYYWRESGLDNNLRRQETVTHVYNNNPNPDGDNPEPSPENSYYTEVSTHTGQVTLATNKSNGEPVAWTIQVNTKEGVLNVVTDNGHEFSLDAVALAMLAQLSTGTKVELNKNNLAMVAPETLSVEAKIIDFTCKNFKVKADNMKVECPLSEFTGLVKVGSLSTTTENGYDGKAVIDGEVTMKQDVVMEQDVTVTKTLTANKVVSQTNIDAPNV